MEAIAVRLLKVQQQSALPRAFKSTARSWMAALCSHNVIHAMSHATQSDRWGDPGLPRRYGVRAASWVALLKLAACDPSWHMTLSQPIAPATTTQCIVSVLQASTEVDSVMNDPVRGVYFAVPDSTLRVGSRVGWISLDRPADSLPVLKLSIEWRFPIGGVYATPEQTHHLADLGAKLVGRVRSTCAPDVPSAVSCRIEGPPLTSKPPCGGDL
jgi:hypothetical protein